MILSVASPLVAILYNAVSWVDWTAASVMCFARKAVVRGAHARATDTSVIFGLQVVVTALKIVVVGPLIFVVAVTLLEENMFI